MQALLRLFHAVPLSRVASHASKSQINLSCLQQTLPYGFMFKPEVMDHYQGEALSELTKIAIQSIGFSAEYSNSSFHKSWSKIRDASIQELLVEQCIHYLTTYGAELLGIYAEDKVYIPSEQLSIPGLTDDIALILISGLTQDEIKQKLMEFLNSGIALNEDTIQDVIDVAHSVNLSVHDIQAIRNKEVKSSLYDLLEIVPENPTEFLRYVVFKATGKSLLIKNYSTIHAIKSCQMDQIELLFSRYESVSTLEKLASVFYRFKPLFLAFKGTPTLNAKINKLRKLAIKHHQPMPSDYLNEITSILKRGDEIHIDQLVECLERANTFRKIRLAYALKYRTTDASSIVYKIRNEKGYAAPFQFDQKKQADILLKIIIGSIVADVSQRINGSRIYIPSYMHYALPATEKQFTGMIPSGSYISVPNDMIVGIHWTNQDSNRIDLDLSLVNAEAKYGWDAHYRSDRILFSGDMTTAPKPRGASELFYIGSQLPSCGLLAVNYYNYDRAIPVPITLFVGHEKRTDLPTNYMIDPNNVLMQAPTVIDKQQIILGLVLSISNETRFYVSEFALGRAISSSRGQMATHARQYLIAYATHPILLEDILNQAGAEIMQMSEGCDLDLSPQALDKASLIALFN